MPDGTTRVVTTNVNGINADRLRSIVERIENLHEQRKAMAADISDIYREAKSAGFSPAAIRVLIREHAHDPAKLAEIESLVDLYRVALGR